MTTKTNVLNYFYEIKVIEPAFTKFYNNHYKETDYSSYREEILNVVKKQLRHLLMEEKRDLGVAIDVEKMLYNPLKEKGLEFDDIVYIVRELGSDDVGYLEQFNRMPEMVSLTMKGKKWVMDLNDNSKGQPYRGESINYFDLPEKASSKIKILLKEINDLPASEPYPNLISHQLRTLLALICLEICRRVCRVMVPKGKRDLKHLLNFTIQQCSISKEKQILEALDDLKTRKYKDIIDSIVHCDYTTVNPEISREILLKIKNLLSLTYRNVNS